MASAPHRHRARPAHGRALALASLLALAGALPAAAQTNQLPDLRPVGTNRPTVDVGDTYRLEVRFTVDGQPIRQYPIDFLVISSPGGVSGPSNPRFTDASGIASADFTFDDEGSVRIDANPVDSSAGGVSFNITVRGETTGGGGGTPVPPAVGSLQRVTAEQTDLVLGDRQLFEVRVLDTKGQPVSGVALTWTVVESPGSPRGVGATTPSDASGVATGSFGFSVAGDTEIAVSYPGVASVRFFVTTASLGALTPDNRSYRSTGGAFDAICADVFATEVPQPTPLCVYMTGALTDRDSRTTAVEELTATGIGSQTVTAASGLQDQMAAVEARLSALRGGALRQSLNQIALNVGGGVVTDGLLASARSAWERREAFEQRLDQRLVSLYAGMDAADETPAASSAAAPKRDRPWGFFLNARLTQGNRPRGVDETGYDFDTFGATLGFDRAVGANSFMGAAFSWLDTSTDLSENAGTLDVSGGTLTLYGIWEGSGNGYFQATAAYGFNSYDQVRRLELPAVGTLNATSDFDGSQLAASLEGGWSWDGASGTATLFGRASWARAEVDGFRESGAAVLVPGFEAFGITDFGIEVGDQQLDSLLGEAGVDLSRVFQFSGGLFVPQINASYLHEFDNDGRSIRGRFLGDVAAVSSFEIFTDDPDRDYFNVGASVRFQFLWGSFFVAFDKELQRDDLDLETWNGGLRFEF